MAKLVITLSRQDLQNKIARLAFRKFDRIGRLVVAAVKADISEPVTVTGAKIGALVGGRRVRAGRGPYKGKRILGSRQGEFPRKETGELFNSISYRVRFTFSLQSPLVLNFISVAKHGRLLEEKSPERGGRPWLSRTIRRLIPAIRRGL